MQIKLRFVDISEFVGTIEKFKSDVDIRSANNGIIVDAKSIMSVLALDLGSKLVLGINSNNEEEIKRFNKAIVKYKIQEGIDEI